VLYFGVPSPDLLLMGPNEGLSAWPLLFFLRPPLEVHCYILEWLPGTMSWRLSRTDFLTVALACS
jgi:hypothetical protein